MSFARGDQVDRARFRHHDPARRPDRADRPQRQRQDHAAQAAAGRAAARHAARSGSARSCRWRISTSTGRRCARTGTRIENVAEGRDFIEIGGRRKHVLGYLQDFLFTPERARAPITRLSGGERNRLLLARSVRAAVQPAGDGRTDQRSGRGDAGTARGTACRIRRNAAAGQPRPRFPRQRGHLDAGAAGRRRRPHRRVRRRLQRLAATTPAGDAGSADEIDAGCQGGCCRRRRSGANSATRTRANSRRYPRGSRRSKRRWRS